MDMLSLIGASVVMCVLIVAIRECKPELALPLSICCGVVITVFLMSFAADLVQEIYSVGDAGGIPMEYLAIGLKAAGICVAVQTASDACRDAGQSMLANKLEWGGKLALLAVSLPLFRELLALTVKIIGE